MVYYGPATFGGPTQCVSGDNVFSGWTAGFQKLLLNFAITVYLCLKHIWNAWKYAIYHVDKSDIGHTPLKQIWKKNANNFCQSVQNSEQ